MKPVSYGGRRVRGLHERASKDGAVTFYGRLRIDGEDKRVVLQATTKTDAVREYENLRADRNRGHTGETMLNPTVAEVADEWLAHVEARVGLRDETRRRSPATVANYRNVTTRHVLPTLGAHRVATVDTGDLRRLIGALEGRGLAPMTVTLALRTTGLLLAFAHKGGYIDRNPYRDLGREDRPGNQRATEPRYLTASEVTALLAHAGDDYRPILAAMVYTGLRIGEALGLLWRDVDLKAGTIDVNHQLAVDDRALAPLKSKSSAATIPLPPALRRELVAHRARQATRGLQFVAPDAFAFARTGGQRIGMPPPRESVQYATRRFAGRAGLNREGLPTVSPHDLRHTAGALALQSGANLAEVCELLRHASPAVTLAVYAGLTEEGRGGASRKLLAAGFGA